MALPPELAQRPDEPEQALAAYPGASLLVSHDATFAERTTSGVWSIQGDAVNAL